MQFSPLLLLSLIVMSAACGKPHKDHHERTDEAPAPQQPSVEAEKVRPVLPDQAYGAEDESCFNLANIKSCTQDRYQRLSTPESVTVEKVLKRSFVHQPWAGKRLEQVLSLWPAELLPLASCASAIIIGNSVNPAHYSSGGVYLDPRDFAVTPEERATLNLAPDPREAGFVKAPFREARRFVKTARYIFQDSPLSNDEKTMVINASYVLIHELSHACDLNWPSSGRFDGLSDRLSPLADNTAFQYAQAYFQNGGRASDEVLHAPLDEYLAILAQDESVQVYDYSTRREHFADLSHVLLLQTFMGVDNRMFHIGAIEPGTKREDIQVESIFDNKLCAPQVWQKARAAVLSMQVFRPDLIPEQPACEFKQTRGTFNWVEYNKTHAAEFVP